MTRAPLPPAPFADSPFLGGGGGGGGKTKFCGQEFYGHPDFAEKSKEFQKSKEDEGTGPASSQRARLF